ncbi:MAG: 50S ribosomal protein L37ae [DPANN group archaeon]|nr:50S ribosomal protein L37ae [DPANN group archaeon]
MAHTKKVGSTGRFGAHYGLKIRKKVLEIERIQKAKHKCPYCGKFTVKRLSAGIWICRHCHIKFAGKAYEPGVTKESLEAPLAASVPEEKVSESV